MSDHAYAIYEANAADEARAEGLQDLREQEADSNVQYRPDRLCLLDARFNRCFLEATDLAAEIDGWSWELKTANDSGELWMRALESALAQAREAMKYIREHTK